MTARPIQRRLVLLALGAAGLRAAQAQPKARVGWLVLTKTQLIFTSKGSKCEFRLDSFRDANINDNAKSINLKLILEDSKPMFQMLGVNRDHAQELFMKMNAFRIALKEQTL